LRLGTSWEQLPFDRLDRQPVRRINDVRVDVERRRNAGMNVLKNDTRAIFTAATHAQRAADFLRALHPPEPP
jgi:antirestriction protein ArdC